MNWWKVGFFSTIFVCVLTNIYWVYSLIDIGISYGYLQDSYDERSRNVSDLGKLIVDNSTQYSKQDILHLLRQSKPDAFIIDEGDTIVFEGIHFNFSEGKLAEVR